MVDPHIICTKVQGITSLALGFDSMRYLMRLKMYRNEKYPPCGSMVSEPMLDGAIID